jgi:hypothetical protein
MPRDLHEIARFYRGKTGVDFRTVRAKDHFNPAVCYLPFDDFHRSTQSPFTHSPTPPFAAKGSGLEQDDGFFCIVAEAAEGVPEALGAEASEVTDPPEAVADPPEEVADPPVAEIPVVAEVVAAGSVVAAVVVVLLADMLASGS